jgi:hypothetical protein
VTCIHLHIQSFEAGFGVRPSRMAKADRAGIVFIGWLFCCVGFLGN